MKIMTLNLKNNKTWKWSKTYWKRRVIPIQKLIEEESPDLIGTQECSSLMLNSLEHRLPHYQALHSSRGPYEDDNAIFIKTSTLKVLKSDIICLSKTPNFPHTKNFTSSQARTCSYAQVTDGNNIFDFYNTHLDFLLPKERLFQLKIIKNWILEKRTCGHYEILVGDFNTNNQKVMDSFEKQTELKNIITNAMGTTFRSYPKQGPIDHIFLSPNLENEAPYKNGKAYDAIYPSDHFAVLTKIKKTDKKARTNLTF